MNSPRKEALIAEVKKRKTAIVRELKKRGELDTGTVVGFVCPEKGLTHALRKIEGQWVASIESPDVYLPAKMERVLTTKKRFVILIGGRGSAKSVGGVDICMIDAKDDGDKTYFLREYQSSIKNSVHSLITEEAKRLEFSEFNTTQNSISCNDEEVFSFAGLARNVDSIKSAFGFKRYSIEEAQFITEDSLMALTPTAREKPKKGLPSEEAEMVVDSGVSMLFIANPGSTEDPFSKRFINPYIDKILSDGYYEDDLHLIVMMNYTDNPWFAESGLEIERLWDYENRPRALYDHIWLGAMNDSVENALVMSEWFDACIDAHKKLGFEPRGSKIAAHDPSDIGPDSKGYVERHGVVITDIQEKTDGNVNDGGHWASQIALESRVDYFTWDCDGMGVALSEQMSQDFEGKGTTLSMFKGSESPDTPKAIYSPALKAPIENQKSIGDSFINKRAQYYYDLRDRCYRTYRAVMFGEYHDPDTLISFSSEMPLLAKLRSEICRLPVKENRNGLFALYTKPELKSKFKIESPNLGDSLMMCLRYEPRTAAKKLNFSGWNG
ncbi:MAG: PBSX family phage terminase large subunit [Blastopirellula sp.]|nr:MAG: PBSX family phage terminase large subunit [Blastopirellula sp.]